MFVQVCMQACNCVCMHNMFTCIKFTYIVYMYVCVFVCICVYGYECMYVYMYVCMYAYMLCLCTCICMYVYVHDCLDKNQFYCISCNLSFTFVLKL